MKIFQDDKCTGTSETLDLRKCDCHNKMGGGSDFDLPAVNDIRTIDLGADANLSAGMTCGAFNPLVSITNTFNDLQNNIDNITQGLWANAKVVY